MESFPRTDQDLSSASPSSQTPTNIAHPAYHDLHPVEQNLVALIREEVSRVHRSPTTLRGVALELIAPPQPSRDISRRVDSGPIIPTMAETMSPIGIANVRIPGSDVPRT